MNTVKHRRWNFVRKCLTACLKPFQQLNFPPVWSSILYMFVMIGFYSKRDSESCYIRHYEDTSYSQRPEAATRGGALSLWKKRFLEISQNLQENVCVLVKRLWHWCFPVNFAKFLRTPFLQNTPGRLLLNITSFKAFGCISDLKLGRYRTISCKNQSKTRPNKLVSSTD